MTQAEEIKIQHGHADSREVGSNEFFNIRPFGEQEPAQISRLDLAQIIEARVEEIFGMVVQEIKRSGYDGLLPAGMVLTGGTSQLPGIRTIASNVLGVSVRLARPENMIGMVDRLDSPAYSTSVGLLRWAMLFSEVASQGGGRRARAQHSSSGSFWDQVRSWLRRLLP
jgi:cell division protein FtsA